MNNDVVVGGIYRHFKNPTNRYKIIGIAKNSVDLSDMVIYEAQYENNLAKLWARPIDDFANEVVVEGKKVKRFERMD